MTMQQQVVHVFVVKHFRFLQIYKIKNKNAKHLHLLSIAITLSYHHDSNFATTFSNF